MKAKVDSSLQYGDLLQPTGGIFLYLLAIKMGDLKPALGVQELLRALPPKDLPDYALRFALDDSAGRG